MDDSIDARAENAHSGSGSHLHTSLPTQDELPYDDGDKMESDRHAMQLPLLKETLVEHWKDRDDFFIGTNMYVYFDPNQEKNRNFRGPDAFVALGVKPHERKSFVIWDEGKGPDVIIEITSPSTKKVDRVHKKQIYQDDLRVQEYFWCDPFKDDFAGFELKNGKYKRIEQDARGMLPSKVLGLGLTQWKGTYNGLHADYWLRWATPKGIVLPTHAELEQIQRKLKDAAMKRAEEADKRAEDADKRADALAELLKKHGIEPDA